MKKLFSLYLMLMAIPTWAMIVPPNDLYIPTNQKSNSTTEADFNRIIDSVAELYSETDIEVYKFWEDGMVNAYAENIMGVRSVNFSGGFARLPEMTEDAFALVVCHEYGHHLGGAPRKSNPYSLWASSEGQADYFATTKCLKRYFKRTPETQNIKMIDQCLESESPYLCSRIALAGEQLTKIFHIVEGSFAPEPALMNSSTLVANKTLTDEYPTNQCRLDTYVAGALCTTSTTSAVHQFFPEIGYCHIKNGHKTGLRPRCWFRP